LLDYSRKVKLDYVDPQLRNNKDLVKNLFDFEESYNVAKEHFGSSQNVKQLQQFSILLN